MTTRKIVTLKVSDPTPNDHLGRLGEITYRDGFLYYHDGTTPGGNVIGSSGSGGPTSWASVTGKPSFAAVATSGSYADLTGKPSLFSGNYADLVGKPNLATVATSGSYNDLTDKPTLITGPKGDKGDKGDTGATGATGATGPQGPAGVDGAPGATGPQGPQGLPGDKGETGAQGPQGETGAQGPAGAKGDKGDKGDTGDTGPQGPMGATGEKGDKGDTGDTGPQGPAGTANLPADAVGYLVNDGTGNLSWAAGDGTFSGDYNDLVNKPSIPAAQVNADWNETISESPAYIFNKPAIPDLTGYATEAWVNSQGFGSGSGSTGDFVFTGSTLTLTGDGNEDMSIKALDDLYLDALDDDVHVRANDDIRLRTGYNFTDEVYQWELRYTDSGVVTFFNSSEGNDYGFIQPVNNEGSLGMSFEGRDDAYIKASYGSKTWKFANNGDLVLPAGGDIKDSTGTSVLGGGGPGLGNFSFTDDKITFPDGTIQTTAYVTPQQYGYINEVVHTGDNNRADMQAVAMDSAGNSYSSYSYYDENENRRYGGVAKFSSTGAKLWSVNLQSTNSNAEYSRIVSLEYTTLNVTDYLVAIGYYYDNTLNRDRGFMCMINPANGETGTGFDLEFSHDGGLALNDAVFGLDSSNAPFAVMVGQVYNDSAQKSFTPLAGSTVDKVIVSWAEYNASGLQAGETVYYNENGNSYGVTMNKFDVGAGPDGEGAGLWLQVKTNEDGTYGIIRSNGWSGTIYGWANPVNVRVLGSALGGVDGVNDMTFDFSSSALDADSNNIAGWASNIQGTPVSGGVVGIGWGNKDWSTAIGNTLTFDFQLNNQAFIARMGNNVWMKTFGSADTERLLSVVVDSSGNAYASGYAWSSAGKSSLVAKFDVTGAKQWSVYIDPSNNTGEDVTSIDLLSDGSLITVTEDRVITKLNSSDGSIIWQVTVDSDDNESWDGNFRGTATPDGNYIVTNFEDDNYKLFVICVSGTDGTILWQKVISRAFGNQNGEVYAEDDYSAQYIDCNADSVTIAGTSEIYLNGTSIRAGIVINFPVTGENTDGFYGQYIIAGSNLSWDTESTTSVPAVLNETDSMISSNMNSLTSSESSLTVTKTVIGGEEEPVTGDIAFDGSKLSSPAAGSGNFPLGVITLAPGATSETAYADYGQFINIYPTNAFDSPHIHIAPGSGNNSTGNLILGDDNYHIDINNNGSIYVKTNNQNYSWEFDTSGNLRLPSGGDIKDSSGNSVLGGGGSSLPRASVMNTPDPDVTCDSIRVMMNNGVITVRESSGNGLALVYSGRTVTATGTQTMLSTGGTSVNSGEALTLATLANRGDSMIIDYLYDANTNKTYRINVMVTWSSLPYGGIIIERIA